MRINTTNRQFFMVLALLLTMSLLACKISIAQEILRPEAAFPYTIEASEGEITLTFQVEDGYYLYRERFGFEALTDDITLGAAELPNGQIYEDEFFGVMETYRNGFQISIPYQQTEDIGEIGFRLMLQGCADIGLCYPPQRWDSTVALTPNSSGGGSIFSNFLTQTNPNADILSPDEAFIMDPRVERANEITLSWIIQPGYYLYKNKFEFSIDGPIQIGTPRFPSGVLTEDEYFGEVEVYYDYVEVKIPFSRASPNEVNVQLDAYYQGCKVDSICYPLINVTRDLGIPASNVFDASAPSGSTPFMVSEQDRLASIIMNYPLWAVLGIFYGLGLLLSFTPCVLPMVPILSGLIAGQGANVTPARGFMLSLSYVMGMSVTYTGAGALAAIAGGQIQAIFQQPWILTLFAGLFVILSLAMFGVFQLQIPAPIQNRLTNLANSQKNGTFIGVAIIGALSALIVTTCVAPPLVATLAVIGQSGDVLRGSSALFFLSLGMGSPLLLVGASAGKLLPKVGPWMNMVRASFGVMMLGLAIWMMERILPGSITLALWALLVFLTGVFLGAFEALPKSPSSTQRLGKGLGLLACLYGALMIIGATLGGNNPLNPIPQGTLFAGSTNNASISYLPFQSIDSVAELEEALLDASNTGTPVMVDFTADWCVACKEYERYTFPDTTVIAALDPFMLLQIDVTDNNDDDQALLEYFSSFGPPTIAFFDRQGQELEAYKLVGFVGAEEFSSHVLQVSSL
ncbi:MAG: protein-disulfide reductase DsbD [Gammaproteobacteria bacterium]|nr:protein-disulfide reductase DsbD [Gammaproteobacteria bacterium]